MQYARVFFHSPSSFEEATFATPILSPLAVFIVLTIDTPPWKKFELGKRIEEETGNYLGLNLVLAPALEEENSRETYIHSHKQTNKTAFTSFLILLCLLS
jgi:hypothetical protein